MNKNFECEYQGECQAKTTSCFEGCYVRTLLKQIADFESEAFTADELIKVQEEKIKKIKEYLEVCKKSKTLNIDLLLEVIG